MYVLGEVNSPAVFFFSKKTMKFRQKTSAWSWPSVYIFTGCQPHGLVKQRVAEQNQCLAEFCHKCYNEGIRHSRVVRALRSSRSSLETFCSETKLRCTHLITNIGIKYQIKCNFSVIFRQQLAIANSIFKKHMLIVLFVVLKRLWRHKQSQNIELLLSERKLSRSTFCCEIRHKSCTGRRLCRSRKLRTAFGGGCMTRTGPPTLTRKRTHQRRSAWAGCAEVSRPAAKISSFPGGARTGDYITTCAFHSETPNVNWGP